jgi:hypothetical protein
MKTMLILRISGLLAIFGGFILLCAWTWAVFKLINAYNDYIRERDKNLTK